MNTKLKKIFITLSSALGAILLVTTATYAIGTLTPQGTAGDDTQYSLTDIYNKLTDFSTSTNEGTGSMTVPGAVSATFHTLSEIYAKLEAEDSDLVASNIKDGVEIFGVEGTLSAGVSYPTQWSADDPTGYVDWSTAMSYCASLEENGHTDWRLPTYIELVNAYLAGVTGFQSDGYWSSTEFPSAADSAYYVYMGFGNADVNGKATPNYYARCAR